MARKKTAKKTTRKSKKISEPEPEDSPCQCCSAGDCCTCCEFCGGECK